MKKLIIIFCVAWAAIAVSKGIIEKFNTDKLQFGVTGSSDEKSITVETGDGVNNPRISVDTTDKEFTFNRALNVISNIFRLGDGTIGSEAEIINNNGTANPPKIKFDNGLGAWTFSNDGTLVKKFGSGSGGGGGGINLAQLQGINVGFEDGFDVGWSGTAGVASEANSGLQLNGEKSLILDTTTQGDFYETPTFNIIEGLKGVACQFGISYKGGNGEINAQLLIDGVVAQEIILKASSIKADESVGFICPQTGSFKVRFEQILTADAVAATIDDIYVGTFIGTTESTTPDIFTAKIDVSGNIVSQSSPFISGPCSNSNGTYTCPMISGLFNEIPALIGTKNFGNNPVVILDATTTSFRFNTNSGATTSSAFDVMAIKQGSDAKQSVQVYNSIPKVVDNVNSLSAKVSSTGVVSDENTDWIDGDCTFISTGIVDCPIKSGVFSIIPSCLAGVQAEGAQGSQPYNLDVPDSSPTSLRFGHQSDSGPRSSEAFIIKCEKSGLDFKLPTVQPIIVGQVRNSAAESSSKNITSEYCKIDNNGTATIDNSSGLCDSWISSVTTIGTGRVQINFSVGAFSKPVICNVTHIEPALGDAIVSQVGNSTNLSVVMKTASNSGTEFNQNFNLSCTGEK